MDIARMRSLFREAEKSEPAKYLEECGIDVEEMQQRISAVLRHNSRWALSPPDEDEIGVIDSDNELAIVRSIL
jgi:hypothetical protein